MTVTLTGTITEKTMDGYAVPFGVGSSLTLTAYFDPAKAVGWGDTGYQVVGFGIFESGSNLFKLALGDYTLKAVDEINDGRSFFEDYSGDNLKTLGSPAIVFKDGKVAGVIGRMIAVQSVTPVIYLGSGTPTGSIMCPPSTQPDCVSSFSPLQLSDSFTVLKGMGAYGNFYDGPQFNGVWDFAASSVINVPEPATWLFMVLGIGAVGAAMRLRRTAPQISDRRCA